LLRNPTRIQHAAPSPSRSVLIEHAGHAVLAADADDVAKEAVKGVVVADNDELIEALQPLNLIAKVSAPLLVQVRSWLVQEGDPNAAEVSENGETDGERRRHLLATGKLGETADLALALSHNLVLLGPLQLDTRLVENLGVDARGGAADPSQ